MITDNRNPLVSICCITYNHEKFIKNAIEGFLMQKTNFPIEILIHDDASTDGTTDIINEYENKYPNLIKGIYQLENQYSKGIRVSATYVWPRARGKYIALCEGDDYWTDPLKLQKQVDFMEAHPECSMCFHRIKIHIQKSGEIIDQRLRRYMVNRSYYNLRDILCSKVFVPTVSMMIRNKIIQEIPDWFYDTPMGDWPLIIICAQQGNIGLINQFMAIYRLHSKGVWSGADNSLRQFWIDKMQEILLRNFGQEYKKQIHIGISNSFFSSASVNANQGNIEAAKGYFIKSIKENPIIIDASLSDRLVLFSRLYLPKLYRRLKSFQNFLYDVRT